MNPMNGRVLKAAAGGFVAMFVLSFVWYGVVMMDWYADKYGNIMRMEDDISMAYIALGYVIRAFLLAYIYTYGYKGGSGTSEGMRFGVVMGLLLGLPLAFVGAGAWNIELGASLVDGIYTVVEIGVGGTVIGWLYGSDAPAAAPAAAPSPPPAAPEAPPAEE